MGETFHFLSGRSERFATPEEARAFAQGLMKGRQEGFAECRERAAETATAHKGSAAKHRRSMGLKLGHLEPDAQTEIQAEERGEDIAAGVIAREIRALQPSEGESHD